MLIGLPSQSTTEVEYVATTINCTNIVWIKQLLKGMKEDSIEPITLYCDNTSATNISQNHVMHTKTKNIAIKYHYVRELVQDKEVKIEYVNSKEQIADIFTKALPKDAHEYLRGKLGVISPSKAMQKIKGVPCTNKMIDISYKLMQWILLQELPKVIT